VLFPRHGRTRGGEDEDGEQASGSAHQQIFFLWICVALVAGTEGRLNEAHQAILATKH
jgi:hypothetical protein